MTSTVAGTGRPAGVAGVSARRGSVWTSPLACQRVGRGAGASTCLLLYKGPLSEAGEARIAIMRETEDGFRIAEEDLAMRGAGDLIGTAQSGLPKFRIADLERQSALMAVAQSDARRLLADDPGLASPRGAAVRVMLWLMEQDRAIRLIGVG